MIDSLSGQPEPPEDAIEAGARARRSHMQVTVLLQSPKRYLCACGETVDDMSEHLTRVTLNAALPAFLAAGWLPPEDRLAQLRQFIEHHRTEGGNADRRDTADCIARRFDELFAAGWTPAEGEKTL